MRFAEYQFQNVTHSSVSRPPGPMEVVPASDEDDRDWQRFPRGWLHLVALDTTDGQAFSVRVRAHNGSMVLLLEPTMDLGSAHEELGELWPALRHALSDCNGLDPDDAIEIQRGLSAELDSGVDHRAHLAEGSWHPFEIVTEADFDGDDVQRFPNGRPFPLALGIDEGGLEKFAVAMNWFGSLVPHREDDVDAEEISRRICHNLTKVTFPVQYDDVAECQARILGDLAESVFLWGKHVWRYDNYIASDPVWGVAPDQPETILALPECR